VATTARTLAIHENLSPTQAEEAFLAGMLHDVGKVVFATRAAAAGDDPEGSVEARTQQMEAHHAEVGAYLLGLWGFPNSIVEAVAFHHSPSQAAGDGLTLPRLIHIADRLVHQRREKCSGAFDRGLEPDLLEKLKLADRWSDWLATLDFLDGGKSAA
jgi:putative nucleotidyltransferase with HDIG domain